MEAPVEEGLAQLVTEAKEIDRRLADERHTCSQYAPSDPRRNTWQPLKDASEAAWKAVLERVTLIMSLSDDLRRPLDEEFLFEAPAPDGD